MTLTVYDKQLIGEVERMFPDHHAGEVVERLIRMGVVDTVRCKILVVREYVNELVGRGTGKVDAMYMAAESSAAPTNTFASACITTRRSIWPDVRRSERYGLNGFCEMLSDIRINGSASEAVIDIEGVIGVPEQTQFLEPGGRVATYARFAEALAAVAAVQAPRVVVNIRSAGGDVNDALLIFDALQGLGAEVVTRCYGYVASAATVIAQAASPGCREISSNAFYLIHCSESAAEGNSRSLSAAKELLDRTDERIADIYASRSGRPVAGFAALMNENGGKGRWADARRNGGGRARRYGHSVACELCVG